ncbi:MAG: bifunctional diaminohydroxyphosphoribosylaminopyrimidine deaminase/5-amino-6-(5-phosphoribosylamino)uracil reductase RibD [Candidatus Omnitrophota bacterium]
MRQALELAHRGRFTASPNPRVGCVIAQFDSPQSKPRIIGEGYHLRKGMPHAEREALSVCCEDPRGAVMYVTLEPCCHYGATPPCTDAILEAGVRRVIAAVLDPFPAVSGMGIAILREKGVMADVGLLEEEARYENRFFFHRHEKGLPWVVLKAAASLDGKLCTAPGNSRWITGEAARAHVHEMRAEMDTILVGIGTIEKDDPSLTARPEGITRGEFNPPIRIVLDSTLRIRPQARLFQTINEAPVWIFCLEIASAGKRRELEQLGARIFVTPGKEGALDPAGVLSLLAQENILSVYIEGGPRIHTSFLEARLANELAIYIAPKLIGGAGAPTFYEGRGAATMKEAPLLRRIERRFLGDDVLIQGIVDWKE